MNYADLTPNERIAKACEYATILIDEGKLEQQTINEIQAMFSLSDLEAKQAFDKLKSEHSLHYKKSMNGNILRIGLGVVGLVGAAIIYFVFAVESFIPFILLSLIFGLSAIGGIIYIVKASFQKYNIILPDLSKYIPKQKNGKTPFVTSLLFCATLFLVIAIYSELTDSGIVDESEICIIDNLALSKDVSKGSTGSKSKSYYFLFTFSKYRSQARFFDKYYQYAERKIKLTDFKVDDTISIQLNKKDSADFVNLYRYDSKSFDIVNIRLNDKFLINHKERNQLVKVKNIKYRNVAVTIFSINLFVFFFIPVLQRNGFIKS